jgi:hypothetical protein
MMRKVLVLALLVPLTLAGCVTSKQPITLVKEVPHVIIPPDALFNCPQVKKINIPDFNTATNQEIANFIALLYKYNKICGGNMEALKKYIQQAQKKLNNR